MARDREIGAVAGGIAPAPTPAPGLIRLRAVDSPSLGLVAELNGPVLPAGGGMVHEEIARHDKPPIIDFPSAAALVLTIPLLLDRWSTGGSVEREIRALETMYARRGLDVPAPLIVEGIGVPYAYATNPGLRWILTGDPEWGDDIRTRGQDGHRSYVPVTITATQFSTARKVADAAGNKARRFYTVPKTGGARTLRAIAKRYRINDWRRVRTLNRGAKGVPADPDKQIKRGVKVRIA